MGIGSANVINGGWYVMTLGAYFATPSIHVDTLTSRICLFSGFFAGPEESLETPGCLSTKATVVGRGSAQQLTRLTMGVTKC